MHAARTDRTRGPRKKTTASYLNLLGTPFLPSMPSSSYKCALRKCQGRRGCLCPPASRKQLSARIVYGAASGAALPGIPTKKLQNTSSSSTPNSKRSAHPQPRKVSALLLPTGNRRRGGKAGNSANSPEVKNVKNNCEGKGKSPVNVTLQGPTPTTVVTLDPPLDPATCPSATPPAGAGAGAGAVGGGYKVVLRYNHYKKDFAVDINSSRSAIAVASVIERFSFSYGFRGNYNVFLRAGRAGSTDVPRLKKNADGTLFIEVEVGTE